MSEEFDRVCNRRRIAFSKAESALDLARISTDFWDVDPSTVHEPGDYERYGVGEYWRFNPSGKRSYGPPLAGYRLSSGEYQPIEIVRVDEAHHLGRSAALGLDLCWEEGRLRWYDPAAGRYLWAFDREAVRANREAAARQSETARADRITAQRERDAAEARNREMEAEIRRLQG